MQDNLVAVRGKQFARHEAKARRRTRNEYSCHVNSPV
jgi:hypothetical protein